jgi:hypothetical protein
MVGAMHPKPFWLGRIQQSSFARISWIALWRPDPETVKIGERCTSVFRPIFFLQKIVQIS